jgi:hypothetical protein
LKNLKKLKGISILSETEKEINSEIGKSPHWATFRQYDSTDGLNNAVFDKASDKEELLEEDYQYDPRSRSTLSQRLLDRARSLMRARRKQIGNSYKTPLWNTEFYKHPLSSLDQAQGAVNLASVKLQYQRCPSCGPEVAGCSLNPSEAGETAIESTKGSSKPTFKGILILQESDQKSQIVLLNFPRDLNEVNASWVTKLLTELNPQTEFQSTESMDDVKAIQDCHYLMVHQPQLTRKGNKHYQHNPKVYTETGQAKYQLFWC